MTKIVAITFVAFMIFAMAGHAQTSTGVGMASATGKVIGPDSKPQPGVPVDVTGPDGKTTAFTDESGNWSLYNLAPGSYQVQAGAGATTTQAPIDFTVKQSGILSSFFGTKQSQTYRASEMKLDKDWSSIATHHD
jgi:hypothetical protein